MLAAGHQPAGPRRPPRPRRPLRPLRVHRELERRGIEHHLLDWLEIRDESTAAEYQAVARPLIEKLQSEGIRPILVGGSMLYIAAVLNNFEFPARDEALRAELEASRVHLQAPAWTEMWRAAAQEWQEVHHGA